MPKSRMEDLVVQELADETLVYDLQRHKAYCLNRTASLVWRYCDGSTSVSQVAGALRQEMDMPVKDDLVLLAIKQLAGARLLLEGGETPVLASHYTRRRVLQAMGVAGAAMLLPVVVSVIAPTAAQAATCIASNGCAGQPFGTPCRPPQCVRICCGPTGPRPNQCRPAADCV